MQFRPDGDHTRLDFVRFFQDHGFGHGVFVPRIDDELSIAPCHRAVRADFDLRRRVRRIFCYNDNLHDKISSTF
jgi:hypothetical protein